MSLIKQTAGQYKTFLLFLSQKKKFLIYQAPKNNCNRKFLYNLFKKKKKEEEERNKLNILKYTLIKNLKL